MVFRVILNLCIKSGSGTFTDVMFGGDVKSSGYYSVRVGNAGGCLSTASVNAIVISGNAQTATTINASRTTICDGDSVKLTPVRTGALAYRWSTGETTQSITVRTTGRYTVQYKATANGCFSTPSLPANITVNMVPTTPLISLQGDSIFSSVTGNKYIWKKDGVTLAGVNSTPISVTHRGGGTYTLQVVSDGCTSLVSNPIVVAGVAGLLPQFDLSVWPNPSTGLIQLEKQGNESLCSLSVTDVKGKLMKE